MKKIPVGRFPSSHCFLVAWVAVLAAAGPVFAGGSPGEIEIGFVNGVYEDLDTGLVPIQQGMVTIRVSSPEHRLEVHGNRLTLKPQEDGTFAATMEVDFEGAGHLIADVEGIGRFDDDVEAPRQKANASGTVRLARSEVGYLFTVETAEPFVRLEISSGVSRQIGGACRALTRIPFVSLPCAGLEAALSAVSVPMPGPGAQFLLPEAELSGEEKAFFDRFASGG